MELAAVVEVPDEKDFAALLQSRTHSLTPAGIMPSLHSSLLPILGNDVLRTWMDRIHKLGVPSLWLASSVRGEREAWSALRKGVERLLMIKLKSYAEMDLADLLRFHCQRRNHVTEVHDSQGRLGVSVLDRHALSAAGETPKTLPIAADFEPASYPFRGYAKRILSARERQELVGDALIGRCAMRPLGKEIREQVWVGEGVSIASSARVIGPTYIGDRTIISGGATIGPMASVERDCVVDCGTTVQQSTILPGTYLGPGILVREALVDGAYLQDLRGGAIADLLPGGLARKIYQPNPDQAPQSERAASASSQGQWIPWNSATSAAGWREVRL